MKNAVKRNPERTKAKAAKDWHAYFADVRTTPASAVERFGNQVADGLARVGRNVLWKPNPGPQTQALDCQADEIYYGGQPGGGKTDLLLGAAVLKQRKSIILRREFAQLEDIVERSREILGTKSGSYNDSKHRWTLNNGKVIQFGACQHEKDKEKHQGKGRDFFGFDEITHFTESQYLYIIGWSRSSNKGQRTRVIVTGNPPVTAEGRWVALRWAAWLDPKHHNPAKPGEIRWYIRVDDVDTECDEGTYGKNGDGDLVPISREEYTRRAGENDSKIYWAKSRTFIPAQLADNPTLGIEYMAKVDALPEPMRTIFKTGNHFFGLSDQDRQVIPTSWVLLAMERWKAHRLKCKGRIEPPKVWRENENKRQYDLIPAAMNSMGADLARGGKDKNVFARRHLNWFAPLVVVPGILTPTGNDNAQLIIENVTDDAAINLDILNVGSSPFDVLNSLGVPNVFAINFGAGSGATDKSGRLKMLNVRSEAYWRMRELLDPESGEDVMLPDDAELLADLTAPTYEYHISGLKIESKDEIKKRLGRSPDKADAVVMAALAVTVYSWDW